MLTGSPTLHRRLPSLCMQARSLGYSTVWANRAGSQSTNKLRHCCLSLGWDGFPSEPVILLDHLNQSSSNLIIQGWDGFPSEPVILLDHLNQSSSNLIIQGWVKRPLLRIHALAALEYPYSSQRNPSRKPGDVKSVRKKMTGYAR